MRIMTMLLGMTFLISVPVVSAMAGQWRSGLVGKTEQTWSGTLSAVDLRNRSFQEESWYLPRTFVLGKQCDISVMGLDNMRLRDLQPGDSLQVTYRDADGVLIADHIVDRSMRYQGTIQAVDPDSNTISVRQGQNKSRTFTFADEGKVITAEGSEGSLYDLAPGDRVTIVYQLSNHSPLASRIDEMTLSYQGKLEAIDLTERIVKATDPLGEQQFHVADHCQIILGDHKSAHLKDLKLDHDCTISYEQINGVKVAVQIAEVTGTGTNNMSSID